MALPSRIQDDHLADEFIESYFGNVLPENELQQQVMRTYANVFDSFRGPASSRSSGAEILKMITDAHPPSELFSHQVLSNARIASKVRDFLEDLSLHPSPSVPRNERLFIKLAHINPGSYGPIDERYLKGVINFLLQGRPC